MIDQIHENGFFHDSQRLSIQVSEVCVLFRSKNKKEMGSNTSYFRTLLGLNSWTNFLL